jgi:hypothetical protein
MEDAEGLRLIHNHFEFVTTFVRFKRQVNWLHDYRSKKP